MNLQKKIIELHNLMDQYEKMANDYASMKNTFEVIFKIRERLIGIAQSDMTKAESQIAGLLVSNGLAKWERDESNQKILESA